MKRLVQPSRISQSASRGLTLLEVTISTLIVGCLVVTALQSVGNTSRTWAATNQVVDGQALAQDLMREIFSVAYSDPAYSTASTWGKEAGESNRTQFDDVDDYDDWTESPVADASGTALAGYSGWSRSVVVKKLNIWDFSAKSDSSSDTGLRSVTVTATSPTGKKTIVMVYRTDKAGTQQQLSANSASVSWVSCTLQLGSNTPSTMSTALSNHAEDQ